MLVPKMVKNGFNSTFRLEKSGVYDENNHRFEVQKLPQNPRREIKTILHQFRNRDCVKTMFVFWETTSVICIEHSL